MRELKEKTAEHIETVIIRVKEFSSLVFLNENAQAIVILKLHSAYKEGKI